MEILMYAESEWNFLDEFVLEKIWGLRKMKFFFYEEEFYENSEVS